MNRRTLLATSAALFAGTILPYRVTVAQQTGKVFRIGVLVNGGATVDGKANPQFEGLRQGLTQLGYVEGKNVVYEARFPAGQLDRLPGFAGELVGHGVNVIAGPHESS